MLPIYLDHNATTTVPPRVAAAVAEALARTGNPSSIHAAGQAAHAAIESARESVASLLGGVDPRDIVFTSGGTEADTIAVLRTAQAAGCRLEATGRKPHVLVSAIEHPAVLAAGDRLRAEGFEVETIPADSAGRVDPAAVESKFRPETCLVAVMSANNETGSRQPVAAIGESCQERSVRFHVDAVQSAGKEPLDVRAWRCDTAAISAHKFGGPQGAGALWARSVREFQRPGTPNLPGIAGMGEAARMVLESLDQDIDKLLRLRDRLAEGLRARVPGIRFNTPWEDEGLALPNTLNATFEGVPNQTLLMALDLEGVCVSAGPACKSGAVKPSHVLLAMGLSRDAALSTLRFSVGRTNTEDEIDRAVELTAGAIARIRKPA